MSTRSSTMVLLAILVVGGCSRKASNEPLPIPSENLELRGDGFPVVVVAWSPDGKRLASGGVGRPAADNVRPVNKIRIWNPITGEATDRFEETDLGPIDWLTWSPDGKTLATVSYGVVRLWDPTKYEQMAVLEDAGFRAHWAVWSPDGDELYSTRSGMRGGQRFGILV